MSDKLLFDTLITIDETGMPKPPTLKQLIDTEIRELYIRDKTKDKRHYIEDCIVIYYLGDPKSPAKQAGLSDKEALNMAIEVAGLNKSYIPDKLVLHLIDRYYKENITEAGRVVENILKGIHNINLSISKINEMLNEKLNGTILTEDIPTLITMIDNVNKKASELPTILKKLEEAKQNLLYERETETGRGGNIITSSMDSEQSDF